MGRRLADRPASKRFKYPKSSKSERKAPNLSSPILDRTSLEDTIAVEKVTKVSPNEEMKFNAELWLRPNFISFCDLKFPEIWEWKNQIES